MTAPRFNILTQYPVTIDLSRTAMMYVVEALRDACNVYIDVAVAGEWTEDVECEIDNFRNLLENLLERTDPVITESNQYPDQAVKDRHLEPGNLDLIGG